MNAPIFVLDLETTGLDGIAYGDKVLEIGIVKVDLKRKTVTPFFSTVIRTKLTQDQRRYSWVFTNRIIQINEVDESTVSEERAKHIIRSLLNEQYVTSYNTDFDLDRFLSHWRLSYKRSPCVMKACAQIEDIPRKCHDFRCYPSLIASYSYLCADPEHLVSQTHRALGDAMMAGQVLLKLHKKGLYDPERQEEYA